MALTAIVISFGVTAFLLALAYRSWIITDDDEVEDDVIPGVVVSRINLSPRFMRELIDAMAQRYHVPPSVILAEPVTTLRGLRIVLAGEKKAGA